MKNVIKHCYTTYTSQKKYVWQLQPAGRQQAGETTLYHVYKKVENTTHIFQEILYPFSPKRTVVLLHLFYRSLKVYSSTYATVFSLWFGRLFLVMSLFFLN